MDARLVAVVGGAVVVGVAFGIGVDRLWDGGSDARPELIGTGTLASFPRGPVKVRAETVVLPAGFESRHFHGGPTFNFVEAGRVAITDERGRAIYGEDGFFFEPARRPHTIRVLDDATLRVVRLLPPGAAATTELAK